MGCESRAQPVDQDTESSQPWNALVYHLNAHPFEEVVELLPDTEVQGLLESKDTHRP